MGDTQPPNADTQPAIAEPPPDRPSIGYVRRLTHVEYDNTIEDLLGDFSGPAAGFLADVAQNGFTNNAAGQSVSPALAEQYMAAAETLSRSATADLPALMGCVPEPPNEEQCVQQFIEAFGKRAWRRPLLPDEAARLFDVYANARQEFTLEVSVQLVLQVFLQSPQFIYLLEPASPQTAIGSVQALDSWKVATRLSYFITGSTPDDELLAEAEAGNLATAEAVADQARRLLTLPRARERVGLFFTEWLRLRNLDRMQKDATLYPDYDLAIGPMMQEQVQLFAQTIVLDEEGTAKELLTAPFTFVVPELAAFYGVEPPATSEFTRVELDPSRRAGLLTHVGVMASLAKANQTDPVHRGKFVREGLLCESVPPPPPDANVVAPEVTPDATTRERFSQHRSDPACAGCHQLMDPIGLGFEHYDAVGRWRDFDNGVAIDATGEILGSDVAGKFDGAIALSQQLAESEQVMDCIARTWLRFALGRSDTDADEGTLAQLGGAFAANDYVIKDLLVALTTTAAFRHQLVPDPQTTAFPDVSESEEESQ